MAPTNHDRRPSHPEMSKQFVLVILQGLSVAHVKYWTRHLVTKGSRECKEPACCGKYKTVYQKFLRYISPNAMLFADDLAVEEQLEIRRHGHVRRDMRANETEKDVEDW